MITAMVAEIPYLHERNPYKPHTKQEYIILKDMFKSINLAKDIISNLGDVVYEHVFENVYNDVIFENYIDDFNDDLSPLKLFLMDLVNSNLDDETIIEKIYTEILY